MCLKYLCRLLLDIGNDNEGSKDFKSPMLESGASLVTALKFKCVGLRRERFNSEVFCDHQKLLRQTFTRLLCWLKHAHTRIHNTQSICKGIDDRTTMQIQVKAKIGRKVPTSRTSLTLTNNPGSENARLDSEYLGVLYLMMLESKPGKSTHHPLWRKCDGYRKYVSSHLQRQRKCDGFQ